MSDITSSKPSEAQQLISLDRLAITAANLEHNPLSRCVKHELPSTSQLDAPSSGASACVLVDPKRRSPIPRRPRNRQVRNGRRHAGTELPAVTRDPLHWRRPKPRYPDQYSAEHGRTLRGLTHASSNFFSCELRTPPNGQGLLHVSMHTVMHTHIHKTTKAQRSTPCKLALLENQCVAIVAIPSRHAVTHSMMALSALPDRCDVRQAMSENEGTRKSKMTHRRRVRF